ncbi:hypothetical protein EI77_02404 [Prosthecobacter fusiformis]|uniref:Uncharacterized protein n=1 Tax=Prosthecobacter fusiformis TaxID=48464 RepID=A0A4R7RZD2_9BACT|nr:hypothetical protein EI77_02404 [Prosthecobacter fusiformis]
MNSQFFWMCNNNAIETHVFIFDFYKHIKNVSLQRRNRLKQLI